MMLRISMKKTLKKKKSSTTLTKKSMQEEVRSRNLHKKMESTLKKSVKRCSHLESSIVDLEKMVKYKYKANFDKAIVAIIEEQNG